MYIYPCTAIPNTLYIFSQIPKNLLYTVVSVFSSEQAVENDCVKTHINIYMYIYTHT